VAESTVGSSVVFASDIPFSWLPNGRSHSFEGVEHTDEQCKIHTYKVSDETDKSRFESNGIQCHFHNRDTEHCQLQIEEDQEEVTSWHQDN
jgi:hypothetical protein